MKSSSHLSLSVWLSLSLSLFSVSHTHAQSHTHKKLIMGEMTLYSFERYPDKVLQHLLN